MAPDTQLLEYLITLVQRLEEKVDRLETQVHAMTVAQAKRDVRAGAVGGFLGMLVTGGAWVVEKLWFK